MISILTSRRAQNAKTSEEMGERNETDERKILIEAGWLGNYCMQISVETAQ